MGYDHIPVFVITDPFCTGLDYMEGVNQIGSAHSFFPELNFGANAVCGFDINLTIIRITCFCYVLVFEWSGNLFVILWS
jgi:hypothetical protein